MINLKLIDLLVLIILILFSIKDYITTKEFSKTKLPFKFTLSRIDYMKNTTENYRREIIEAEKNPDLYQSLNYYSIAMVVLSTLIFILPYLGDFSSNLKINIDVLDLLALYILSFGI